MRGLPERIALIMDFAKEFSGQLNALRVSDDDEDLLKEFFCYVTAALCGSNPFRRIGE